MKPVGSHQQQQWRQTPPTRVSTITATIIWRIRAVRVVEEAIIEITSLQTPLRLVTTAIPRPAPLRSPCSVDSGVSESKSDWFYRLTQSFFQTPVCNLNLIWILGRMWCDIDYINWVSVYVCVCQSHSFVRVHYRA